MTGSLFNPEEWDGEKVYILGSKPRPKNIQLSFFPNPNNLFASTATLQKDPDWLVTDKISWSKRILDIIISGLGLILTLPLFLIISILIKYYSAGTVLEKRLSVGQDRRRQSRRRFKAIRFKYDDRQNDRRRENYLGSPFFLYRFKTIHPEPKSNELTLEFYKNHPRFIALSRILRQTGLDKLPQLYNVLKGDMSLVGPEPEPYEIVEKFCRRYDNYQLRLKVKPGLTGLAKLANGKSQKEDKRRKLFWDLKYVYNFSLEQDLKILAQSLRKRF